VHHDEILKENHFSGLGLLVQPIWILIEACLTKLAGYSIYSHAFLIEKCMCTSSTSILTVWLMHFSSVFCRARRITQMSNNVANSILSGVLKVSGFVANTLINSKPTRKFFKLMPGEVILASLDGFGKLLSLAVQCYIC
jgi:hypothetical protein